MSIYKQFYDNAVDYDDIDELEEIIEVKIKHYLSNCKFEKLLKLYNQYYKFFNTRLSCDICKYLLSFIIKIDDDEYYNFINDTSFECIEGEEMLFEIIDLLIDINKDIVIDMNKEFNRRWIDNILDNYEC